jgi:hypothetical protein
MNEMLSLETLIKSSISISTQTALPVLSSLDATDG